MSYLEGLNQAQLEGVVNTEGPCMIIAGAGSGKTRVLTTRIAHLITAHKIDPFRIMALTFTNKAAREMTSRIEHIIGGSARSIWMGTFHSVFGKLLKIEGSALGYPSDFTIYDTKDSSALIKSIIKELQLDEKVYKNSFVFNRISSAKNKLISPQSYAKNTFYLEDDEKSGRPRLAEIYKIYVARCKKALAMDFDDLLFNTNILFRDHPDILLKYQNKFRYLLVDEFQDTNVSQYLITKKLTSLHQNICIVGDDAQSIYAFRGANIQNILNFEKDYPDLRVIKLEQNYRSTKSIVEAANSLIAKNESQITKSIWTDNSQGEKLKVLQALSDTEEAKIIANNIFEAHTGRNIPYNNIAVLYRTNSQSRNIEEQLRRMTIPYRIFGGTSFYQRAEIKDLLAYMRFTINPNDEQAFKRIVNLPKRGIGSGSVAKIVNFSIEHQISLEEAIARCTEYLSGRIATALLNFNALIRSFKNEITRSNAFEAGTKIAKESGILGALFEDKTPEGVNRYENVQELLNAVKIFTEQEEEEDRSLGAFLQEVSLLTTQDGNEDDKNEHVTLMTIHMSKGLEFDYCYIVGMEEDLFPSQMMISEKEDLEEERRLFYVALTRAKEYVHLSYALSRYRFGNVKRCEPSRFLSDIDHRFLNDSAVNASALGRSMGTKRYGTDEVRQKRFKQTLWSKPKTNIANPRLKPIPKHQPTENFKPSNTHSLSKGMKVEHSKFGFGKVIALDTSGANRKAQIAFEKHGNKTLLLAFVKLRIIE